MAQPAEHSRRITITIPEEMDDWLREHAWQTRRSVSRVLRDMLECIMREAQQPQARREDPPDM